MQFSVEEYEFIKPLKKPSMDIFSQEEIYSMEKVLNTSKSLTSEKITQCSHVQNKPHLWRVKLPAFYLWDSVNLPTIFHLYAY